METNRYRSEGKRKLYETYNRTVIWLLPLCIALAGALLVRAASEKERELQQEIAAGILRFHVLANSDSEEDQEEKMRVRDAVILQLQPVLASADSKAETKKRVKTQIKQIETTASRIVKSGKVQVSLTSEWFPEKQYGDCTFPEGIYEALRIEIGEAAGHNWWCVLYPGLCFREAAKPVVPEEGKKALENILNEETYDFIVHPHKVKIRFRGWEWLKKNSRLLSS